MKNMRINPFMEIPPAYRMTSIVQSPSTADLFMSSLTAAPRSGSQKKYLVCCLICGSFSCLLGAMFLGIYFLIRSYTFNGYFETVPTYVPAALLMVTGLFIVSFARRKFRYSCLIYFSGVTSATSALICAAVTVTTKVLHMSRLQDLNLNCEYKITTRICTCYSDFEDGPDEARKLLFNAATDCRVAQGDLYSCLQAIFGLSIAGVLVAVFSCMLSYLLYSHERKKMYWEQLDMRCRLLHASHFTGGIGQPPLPLPASIITNDSHGNTTPCIGCCEQCHATTQQAANSNSISGYPYAPLEFPWNDYTNCASSKFLTIAGNNNLHNHNFHNHHHHHNHHNFHHHFGNFFNSNFCTPNQIMTTARLNETIENNSENVITTETSAISSLCSNNINNNNNNIINNTITGSDECGTNNNNNNISNNRNSDCNIVANLSTTEQSSSISNGIINDNNHNNGSRGWRWPRMPWQRNFDFNLFQQALLSRPGSFNPGLDFNNWPGFLHNSNPTSTIQYPSTNYINGYPIGIWGPPPPPYSDPNSPNWRIGNSCNNETNDDSNDNQCNDTNTLRTNSDNGNLYSSQLNYIDLRPPEYSAEPLSIVSPSTNYSESNSNCNNEIESEISQGTK
ncbi:transcription factor mef2A-like [Condylostylus longicornis]|uniref:transcription factor mef2A-like n=1 Tax=Condylostylus longicornis TaxID=2530218 RepID=UPI00244E1EB8|nr:transcription factor mef2A-like [Condylostylus longicornis]XP_055378670.1 transcription factor mef2A-like [Condylostylus longicornis]